MAAIEILSRIAERMLKGIMIHSQFADYYGFLGLEGYQKCHTYRYFDESKSYRDLSDFCLKHCNKILTEPSFDNPRIIPEDWKQYYRQQVNSEVRLSAIKVGIDKWIEWELETKKLYEQCYNSLISENEISIAFEIEKLIKEVSIELINAEQEKIELEIINYDMPSILQEQKELCKLYNKKLKEIKLC